MFSIKKRLALLAITLLQVNQVFAYPEKTEYINSGGQSRTVSGPADQLAFGSIIFNTGSAVHNICNDRTVNYTLRSIVYEPVATWTGRIFQSTSAHTPIPLFESGVPGFSLTPMGGNTDLGYPANFSPLATAITTVWTGTQGTATRQVRFTAGVYLYKDENRLTGSTIIPGQTMYRYLCKDGEGTTQEAYNFVFRPITINGAVTGCAPVNNAVVIEMDKIAMNTIENTDNSTLIGTRQSTLTLQCDPNINVSVSIVDLSDQKNRSETATLTADSTASGVGFAVTGPAGRRLVFGPDGSAVGVPEQQKYFIQNSGNASASRNNPVSTQFGFSYVRKPEEELKAGSAKAVIGFTYSYQ
ncbi:fimbrial protein [Klebsiella sp. BIGb0407]|uniref:fimbrial protein n=1 Tax=Klebsiella sp. BIGb0407 TaxID=2940603 RepID=UPI00216AB29F|nr:fimbrial protein [Klebsiella sp. BIGb0407]MCS3433418.1 hypothetical protein [Klebsiella sp. BIGb0407]